MIRATKAAAFPLFAICIIFAMLFLVPLYAYAGDTSLEAGTIEDEPAEEASAAQIKYMVKSGGSGSWKADGATGSASGSNGIESLQVKIESDAEGSVQYAVHVTGYGWQAVKADSALAGTSGDSAASAGALRIALAGRLSQWYDVQYRVKGSNGSWQAWKSNGQIAGKAGSTLTGIQVKLVEKAQKATSQSVGLLGVRYRAKLLGNSWQKWVANNSIAGKTGKSKRIHNLAIALDTGTLSGGVQYRARLSSGDWTAWKKDGAALGAFSDIEAVQIKLTGDVADDYDVVYRAYVTGVGWQARVRNGGTAGTSVGRNIEAIRVQIVAKSSRSGWDGSGTDWSYYRNGKVVKSEWVKTDESPINMLISKERRYWLDANGKLAVKRVVDPNTKLDKGAGKAYYVGPAGSPKANAKVKTAKGFAFSKKGGLMVTKKGWFSSAKYDGEKQRYRLKSVGSYSVARTGLFKVKGKKYYGLPGKGYLLRDATKRIQKKWYTAKPKGVLRAATKAEVHRERYVQWAVSIANDDSHGYTQNAVLRWGPDYDCSSLVISSLKNTGLKVGSATYTGNMRSELTSHGFRWHTDFSNLKRGDILLVHSSSRQHTEIYLGDNMTVGAHIAENGTIYGVSGDQTGHEIDVGPYYQIWDGYLRYKG